MMTAQKLIRWSHLALMIGGLYEVVVPFFFPSKGFIGIALLLSGLIGLHARQVKKVGWLGHLGITFILISTILPVLFGIQRNSIIEIYLPTLLMGGLQLFGIAIYGAATLRANILPKVVGYLFFLSILTTFIIGMSLSYVLIPIGYILFRKKNVGETRISVTVSQGTA
jgi:hypothetical protein